MFSSKKPVVPCTLTDICNTARSVSREVLEALMTKKQAQFYKKIFTYCYRYRKKKSRSSNYKKKPKTHSGHMISFNSSLIIFKENKCKGRYISYINLQKGFFLYTDSRRFIRERYAAFVNEELGVCAVETRTRIGKDVRIRTHFCTYR